VPRRIFRPKRDRTVGGWRKPHNEELRNLYSSLNITRMIKPRRKSWSKHVDRLREKMNFTRKPGGKRPLGRWRRMWEDNIKEDLRETGRCGVVLAQDRGSCEYDNEFPYSTKCWEILGQLSDW
jgi:hypothetical protein